MKTYKSTIPEITLQKRSSLFKKVKITSSRDAYTYAKQFYGSDISIYESMFIMLLNTANNTIGYAKISQGGICGSVIDVKIIAKYAIDSLASSVILIHNHPSGNINPSNSDVETTQKAKQALQLLDITILDHLIITQDDGYYSFSDNQNI